MPRRLAFSLTALLAAAPAVAQRPRAARDSAVAARADSGVLARVRDEGLTRSRVVETATVLSDVFGPRLAGSRVYGAANLAERMPRAPLPPRRAAVAPVGEK